MSNDNQIELLTVSECAELLYTGKGTVYRLLRSGELKGFLLGKSWKIPVASLEKYIKSSAGLSQ